GRHRPGRGEARHGCRVRRGAEVHGHHRRLLRRRQLRDGRPRVRAEAALDVAERAHLRHGRRAGRDRADDGRRRGSRGDPRHLRSRGQPVLLDGATLGRRHHRSARHEARPRARHLGGAERTNPRDEVRHLSHVIAGPAWRYRFRPSSGVANSRLELSFRSSNRSTSWAATRQRSSARRTRQAWKHVPVNSSLYGDGASERRRKKWRRVRAWTSSPAASFASTSSIWCNSSKKPARWERKSRTPSRPCQRWPPMKPVSKSSVRISDIIASAVGCPCRIVRYSERTSTNSRSVIVSGAIQIADSKPSGVGSSAVGYSVVHVDDIEPSGPGGAVRFVRRALGVEAFGINWFELPPNTAGREHDETAS